MKIKVYVSTNKINSRVERIIDIADDDYEGLSERDRNNDIDEMCLDIVLQNLIEWGWDIVEE